jgi:hypothetical protein
MLDKHADCEVSKRDLVSFLINEVQVDEKNCDIRSVDLITPDTLKYSDFCDIFVPKSQKVLAELTAKKPKNLEGHLSYTQCFNQLTRGLYAQAWEHILASAERENNAKTELMRDASFDINQSFREFTDGSEITRDDLIGVM